jgi:hypothetical protein
MSRDEQQKSAAELCFKNFALRMREITALYTAGQRSTGTVPESESDGLHFCFWLVLARHCSQAEVRIWQHITKALHCIIDYKPKYMRENASMF